MHWLIHTGLINQNYGKRQLVTDNVTVMNGMIKNGMLDSIILVWIAHAFLTLWEVWTEQDKYYETRMEV